MNPSEILQPFTQKCFYSLKHIRNFHHNMKQLSEVDMQQEYQYAIIRKIQIELKRLYKTQQSIQMDIASKYTYYHLLDVLTPQNQEILNTFADYLEMLVNATFELVSLEQAVLLVTDTQINELVEAFAEFLQITRSNDNRQAVINRLQTLVAESYTSQRETVNIELFAKTQYIKVPGIDKHKLIQFMGDYTSINIQQSYTHITQLFQLFLKWRYILEFTVRDYSYSDWQYMLLNDPVATPIQSYTGFYLQHVIQIIFPNVNTAKLTGILMYTSFDVLVSINTISNFITITEQAIEALETRSHQQTESSLERICTQS